MRLPRLRLHRGAILTALALFEAGRAAAVLLPAGASILLTTRADEETVRDFARMADVQFESHATFWAERNKRPSIIFAASARFGGVEVRLQGCRDATRAEVDEHTTRYVGGQPVSPAEIDVAFGDGK